MHNLFIIGNGFDLAHDLKTSYKDFIDEFENIHIKKNAAKGRLHNMMYDNIKRIESLRNWCDIEVLYFNFLTNIGNQEMLRKKYNLGLNYTYETSMHLNNDFRLIKEYLAEYLFDEQKRFNKLDGYQELFDTFNSKETTIVNFNYTNTVKKYIGENSEIKLIQIHGELNNEENEIIFGYAANNDESRELQSQNDDELLKNIKKFRYNLADNEHLLLQELRKARIVNVYILGHSIGVSDKLILSDILNHKEIQTITPFYYKNKEGYLENQINIDRIIDDYSKAKDEQKNFGKLKRFSESHPMLQYNSTEQENGKFIEYIKKIKRESDETTREYISFG